MVTVTFQVLDGLERGQVFANLPTPITIGREEDNDIRLNDERVSRFHAKVQAHSGQVILTDLESTNGTRVNGHPVKMRVLQAGDQILIGRCLLVFGHPDELAGEDDSTSSRLSAHAKLGDRTVSLDKQEVEFGSGGDWDDVPFDLVEELFPNGPPALPTGLNALQSAQLSDVVAYAHSRLMRVLLAGREDFGSDSDGSISLPKGTWQLLQRLELRLSQYLEQISDPPSE
ncbi:MAG: FHA domain-containing protein [Maioricimonas sp. JB045]|uniref:FHA domain-containing protein n=1 Tax=Maioricimonas sp. JC845 TaxID=3232138 RepID=UPI00345B3059